MPLVLTCVGKDGVHFAQQVAIREHGAIHPRHGPRVRQDRNALRECPPLLLEAWEGTSLCARAGAADAISSKPVSNADLAFRNLISITPFEEDVNLLSSGQWSGY